MWVPQESDKAKREEWAEEVRRRWPGLRIITKIDEPPLAPKPKQPKKQQKGSAPSTGKS
jgi:hypothetical protein